MNKSTNKGLEEARYMLWITKAYERKVEAYIEQSGKSPDKWACVDMIRKSKKEVDEGMINSILDNHRIVTVGDGENTLNIDLDDIYEIDDGTVYTGTQIYRLLRALYSKAEEEV